MPYKDYFESILINFIQWAYTDNYSNNNNTVMIQKYFNNKKEVVPPIKNNNTYTKK